jgi:hypothetical protein
MANHSRGEGNKARKGKRLRKIPPAAVLAIEKLDEEGLSAVLAGALSLPGLAVTQESYSNGHVDILINAYFCIPARTKLCEAKIYDGPVLSYSRSRTTSWALYDR